VLVVVLVVAALGAGVVPQFFRIIPSTMASSWRKVILARHIGHCFIKIIEVGPIVQASKRHLAW